MFDSVVAKYELQTTGYNSEDKCLKSFPTSRIKIDDKYFICVSIHKWTIDSEYDKSNRGLYLAVYKICEESHKDKLEENKTNLNKLMDECTQSYIADIVSGKDKYNIQVFKFSVNCWRPVNRKNIFSKKNSTWSIRKKWEYIGDKPDKNGEPTLQRFINT